MNKKTAVVLIIIFFLVLICSAYADSYKVFFEIFYIGFYILIYWIITSINNNIKKRGIKNIFNRNILKGKINNKSFEIYKTKEELEKEKLSRYSAEISSDENKIIEKMEEADEKFNKVLFLEMAHHIAEELIKTKIVKEKSAKYLYQAINKKVILIHCPNFISFKKLDNYYMLKMNLDQVTFGHTCDYYEEKIDSIDREKRTINSYEMTFVKHIDKTNTKQCPRCGAPLEKGYFNICKYCFKISDIKENKKIQSNVSKFNYDIPKIEFEKILPENCLGCGAPLKKEQNGICEYCKSNNDALDNKWVLVQFEEIFK